MTTDTDFFDRCNENIIKVQLIRCEVYRLIHRFFDSKGYVFVDPPILHEQIPEKKGEIYLPIYNNRYSLNSSNALFMAAYVAKYERVYSISATFRDEWDSVNHLLEFRMLEVESLDMTFDEMINFVEKLLLHILEGLLKSPVIKQYRELYKRINSIMEQFPIMRKPYYEWLDELNKNSNLQIDDSTDLSSIDYVISNYLKQPLFIVNYPRKLASWTAKVRDVETSYAFNLMLPDTYGELCEGCQRNNDAEQMRSKFKCARITNLEWFISSIEGLHEKRCGFGIGIERLLRWIVGAEKISDVVLFPRIKDMEND